MNHEVFLNLYGGYLRRVLRLKRRMKVVFDCSNGTAGLILKELVRKPEIGNNKLEIFLINDKPDGDFPAHGPDPTKAGALADVKREVLKRGADLGVVFDADGDRTVFVDERGRELTSGQATILMAKNIKGLVVVDLTTSRIVKDLLGKRAVESAVGGIAVKNEMKKNKALLGSETSGHFYFKIDNFYFNAGALAAVKLINEVSRLKQRLGDWLDELPKYYQKKASIKMSREQVNKKMKALEVKFARRGVKISKLDGLKIEGADWWLNIRPSNTEDVVRISGEAMSKAILKGVFAETRKEWRVARIR